MKKSTVYQSVLGFVVCASVLAGCSTPRKQAEPPVAATAAATADVPAGDTQVQVKSPVDLGAASSGQGL